MIVIDYVDRQQASIYAGSGGSYSGHLSDLEFLWRVLTFKRVIASGLESAQDRSPATPDYPHTSTANGIVLYACHTFKSASTQTNCLDNIWYNIIHNNYTDCLYTTINYQLAT